MKRATATGFPAAMKYSPAIEYITLFGKNILSFTKKELAAYIVFLIRRHEEMLAEKNRQTQKIISLRRRG